MWAITSRNNTISCVEIDCANTRNNQSFFYFQIITRKEGQNEIEKTLKLVFSGLMAALVCVATSMMAI